MTDCEKVLAALSSHEWVNVITIMEWYWPGCKNVAIRSRVSDLKKKGYPIISRIADNRQAEYKLIKIEPSGQMVMGMR